MVVGGVGGWKKKYFLKKCKLLFNGSNGILEGKYGYVFMKQFHQATDCYSERFHLVIQGKQKGNKYKRISFEDEI